MSSNYAHILEACARNGAAIVDPAKGRDGLWGVSLVTGDKYFFVPRNEQWKEFRDALLASDVRLGVWDLRRIIEWPLEAGRVIWDVKSLCYNGDYTLPALAQAMTKKTASPIFQRFLDLDQKVVAHSRALKTARIDMPVAQAIPVDLLMEWIRARSVVIYDLMHRAMSVHLSSVDDYGSRWPFIMRLREMESNSIRVDVPYIDEMLRGDPDPATAKVLRSLQGLNRDGYVTTLLNPMGAKTGRLRHEGGFNTLGIPHGPARDAIIPRHKDGLIYTFDFNAIDYRCVVKAVGGEVARLYEGSDDFHGRTASFIFKEVTPARRTNIKYLSYIYIYGGSDETLVERTGWSLENVRLVLDLLDKKIQPIKEFRERLWMEGTKRGSIEIPGGRRVAVGPDDSPGKVLGLYAQSYSSWVFEQAFVRVADYLHWTKSAIIFAVHDELVIDAHPDDFASMQEVLRLMQQDGNVIKVKKGPTYGQQAD